MMSIRTFGLKKTIEDFINLLFVYFRLIFIEDFTATSILDDTRLGTELETMRSLP